jgi:hypothetical protein
MLTHDRRPAVVIMLGPTAPPQDRPSAVNFGQERTDGLGVGSPPAEQRGIEVRRPSSVMRKAGAPLSMVPVADRLERLHLILHGVTEPTDVPHPDRKVRCATHPMHRRKSPVSA